MTQNAQAYRFVGGAALRDDSVVAAALRGDMPPLDHMLKQRPAINADYCGARAYLHMDGVREKLQAAFFRAPGHVDCAVNDPEFSLTNIPSSQALASAKASPNNCEEAMRHAGNNDEVAKACIAASAGNCLTWPIPSLWSRSMRDDTEWMGRALASSECYLPYASKRLRADRTFMRAACNTYAGALYYASKSLREDSEFVEESMRLAPRAACYAGPKFRGNHSAMREAIIDSSKAQDDRDCNDPNSAPYTTYDPGVGTTKWLRSFPDEDFDTELRRHESKEETPRPAHPLYRPDDAGDCELMAAFVHMDPHMMRFASDRLRKEQDFVIEVARRNVEALRFAHEVLRDDAAFMAPAVVNDSRARKYCSLRLQSDVGFPQNAMGQGWPTAPRTNSVADAKAP